MNTFENIILFSQKYFDKYCIVSYYVKINFILNLQQLSKDNFQDQVEFYFQF